MKRASKKNIQDTKMKIESAKFMYSFELSYINLRMISAISQNSVSSSFSTIKLTSHHP